MSDMSVRSPNGAACRMADALLRSLGGTTVNLQVAAAASDNTQLELGITATGFQSIPVGPAVIRKLRPSPFADNQQPRVELLLSAAALATQAGNLKMDSADTLLKMALSIVYGGICYLIETVAPNEAFGQVYLYRILLRESLPEYQVS
jgi:hypothetical protein